MLRRLAIPCIHAALLATGGCTALSMAPEPVLTRAAMREATDLVKPKQALETYGTKEGEDRDAYRNEVMGIYITAVDANYYDFRARVAQDQRETAVGMDLLVLTLSGAAAVARTSALDELAAAIAVTTGMRASIDKNLFFDSTLPAVLSATDAERAKVRKTLHDKMKLGAAYSLADGFNDIHEYQLAGTLNRGVARLVSVTAADAAAEKARLDAALLACDGVTAETAKINERLHRLLMGRPAFASADQTRRLGIAAEVMGASVDPKDNDASWDSIVAVLEKKYCVDADRIRLADEIQQLIGG